MICPFITEKLLMGRKESNQTKSSQNLQRSSELLIHHCHHNVFCQKVLGLQYKITKVQATELHIQDEIFYHINQICSAIQLKADPEGPTEGSNPQENHNWLKVLLEILVCTPSRNNWTLLSNCFSREVHSTLLLDFM